MKITVRDYSFKNEAMPDGFYDVAATIQIEDDGITREFTVHERVKSKDGVEHDLLMEVADWASRVAVRATAQANEILHPHHMKVP